MAKIREPGRTFFLLPVRALGVVPMVRGEGGVVSLTQEPANPAAHATGDGTG